VDVKNKVIIAGFGHFGSTVGRLLRANGVDATVLDSDSDQVDLLRKIGFKVFYGDATRHELLEAAGAHQAEVLVCAIAPEAAPTLVEVVHKHFPHLKLYVRSRNRFDAYDLMDQGVLYIYRETLDTSIRVGVDVLRDLGYRGHTAQRAGQNFRKYDIAALKKLASLRHNMGAYVAGAKESIAEQERLMRDDIEHDPAHAEHAWNSEVMRNAVNTSKPGIPDR